MTSQGKNKDVLNRLNEMRFVLMTLAVLAISAVSFQIIQYKNNSVQVSTVQSGIHTCFHRVMQSYSAAMMGLERSQYLSSSFLNSTEQCFAEVQRQFEKITTQGVSSTQVSALNKSLNNMSSRLYWMQAEFIDTSIDDLVMKLESGVVIDQISSRFQTIERLQRQALGEARAMNSSIASWTSRLQLTAIFLAFFLVTFSLVELTRTIRHRNRIRYMNQRGESWLESKTKDSGDLIELVSKAMEENNLHGVLHALDEYLQTGQKVVKHFGEDEVAGGSVKFVDPEKNIDDQLNAVWDDSEIDKGKDRTRGVHLDHILANIIDRFSTKLFAHRISLDLDVDSEIYVKGDRESIELIFFHLLQNTFERIDAKKTQLYSKKGKISLKAKKSEEEGVLVSVEDDGVAGYNSQIKIASTDLDIASSLIRDIGGDIKVIFDGEKNKSYVKLISSNAQTLPSGPRLTHLKKGTKKEIQRQILEGPF